MPFLIVILILVNFASWKIIFDFQTAKPYVAFLNIGQGNGILIANQRTVTMYDAGPNGFKTLQELSKLLPFYKKRVDLLLLSHSDKDHYGGAFEILNRYAVSAILINPIRSSESGWLELLNQAKHKNIPIIALSANDQIKTPSENFLILSPPLFADKKIFKSDNQNSLVLRLRQGFGGQSKTFLFTGDIDRKVERLLTTTYTLQTDYLLIPHHGSKYSTSNELLIAANPRMAVIQVGRNRYGHPHPEILQRLQNYKIKYWRIDLDGNLKVQ